ncbi:MAG: trimethylamine methyltransferase [Desulfobacteraceae bacterium 4484_190.1]|nr:MAG: trimethylamine methyltransferase [Desulfobacteraceae bacterium 4484_190.1]
MKPVLQVLSAAEIELIHQSALKILSEIGFRFPFDDALELLKKAGADVLERNVARIPEDLVEYAIQKVPKRKDVTLFGRDSKHDITFERHEPTLACMTMAVNVIDPYTRKKRPATDKDLADLTRIADQLEHVRINGGLVTPQDVPNAYNDWYTWATTLKNTTKHITGGMLGARCVRDAAKMGSIAVGDEELFRDRPFISGWVLTLPPLGIDKESLDALMEMSRLNIPSMLSSGPILGTSSPITIAGTIAQAHAEILACLVVAQLVNPGAPVVYTSFARGIDMRTGTISMACPEFGILKVGMAQMGRFLDMPVRMPSMLRDAKVLDAQAGFETGMIGTVTGLVADMMDSMQLDMDMVVDFADLPFCNDCMAGVARLARDLVVSEQTIAFEVIREVGHGGSFLGNKHTFSNFRKELWMPELLERRNWDAWERDGSRDIYEVARGRMLEMLETEVPRLLSPEAEEEINRIVRDAQEESPDQR